MKKIILYRRLPVMGAAREPGTEIAVGDPKKAARDQLIVTAADARDLIASSAAGEVPEALVAPEATDGNKAAKRK